MLKWRTAHPKSSFFLSWPIHGAHAHVFHRPTTFFFQQTKKKWACYRTQRTLHHAVAWPQFSFTRPQRIHFVELQEVAPKNCFAHVLSGAAENTQVYRHGIHGMVDVYAGCLARHGHGMAW